MSKTKVLAEFRNGVEVMDVYHPLYCSNSTTEASPDGGGGDFFVEQTDDLAEVLYSSDHNGLGRTKRVHMAVPNPNGGWMMNTPTPSVDEKGIDQASGERGIEGGDSDEASRTSEGAAKIVTEENTETEQNQLEPEEKVPERKVEKKENAVDGTKSGKGSSLLSLLFDDEVKKVGSMEKAGSSSTSVGSKSPDGEDNEIKNTKSDSNCKYVLGIPIGCTKKSETSSREKGTMENANPSGKVPPPDIGGSDEIKEDVSSSSTGPHPDSLTKQVGPPEIGGPGWV